MVARLTECSPKGTFIISRLWSSFAFLVLSSRKLTHFSSKSLMILSHAPASDLRKNMKLVKAWS